MKGEAARKAFFDDKSLDFIEGYKILMGSVRFVLIPLNALLSGERRRLE